MVPRRRWPEIASWRARTRARPAGPRRPRSNFNGRRMEIRRRAPARARKRGTGFGSITGRSVDRSIARAPTKNAHRPAAAAPQKKTRPMMDVELIDEKEKLLKNSKKKRAAAVAVALSVTTRVCRATAIPSIHHPSQIAHPPIGRSKTPARARRPHPRVVRQGRRTPAK